MSGGSFDLVRTNKELDIRHVKCASRPTRSVYIVDIAFVRAVVVIYPGTHWFAKACGRESKSAEIYINVCSRKLI